MKNTDIPRIRAWFDSYAESFLSGDPAFDGNIKLKIEHSVCVLQRMTEIADDLGLRGRRRRIALACALLHDVGRFEQLRRHGTFADIRSENHGKLGVKVIEESNVLSGLSDSAAEIILKAVAYHNARLIPEKLTPEQRYFTELTRDADKIDIFRVISEYYEDPDPDKDRTVVHNLPDSPEISDDVLNEFMLDGHVGFDSLRTVTDFKVLQIGWVWDINSREALRRLADLGYIDRILESMPATEQATAVIGRYREFISTLDGEKLLAWTELSRTRLQDCRIFRLYSSERRSSEGKISTAYMIEAPDWVTVVPLLKREGRDYFVMVRQYRHGSMKITTEFPAGTLEKGEEPEDAALRELQEETGYRAGRITWLGSVNPNPAFLTNTFNAYLAEDLEHTGIQNLDEHEYVDYHLVPADEVIKKMGRGEYSNGTMMMALMYYMREYYGK